MRTILAALLFFAAALVVSVAIAGPPGGGQTAFCCLHPDGTRWHTGETNPATGAVMTTQAQVNGACNRGELRPGTRVACVRWMLDKRARAWR